MAALSGFVNFFCSDVLREVEFFRAEIHEHRFPPHAHDHYAVALILDGTFHLERGERADVLRSGAVVCVAPGQVHSGHRLGSSGCRYRMFYIDRSLVDPAIEGALEPEPLYREELFADLLDLHRTCERGSGGEARQGLLRTLKALKADHTPGHQPSENAALSDDILDEVLDLLDREDEAADLLSVGDLAALSGLHPAYFSRLFTARLGLPPHAYRIDRKVQHARRRIAAGAALADVALDLGFADQSHLNRHFKRRFGLAPGAYARQIRG
ncbi:MAG: AraC family transcriptional regulator [Pseudomonadota bacterium]